MSDYFSNIRTYSITCRIHWSTSAKQLWFTDNACNERYLCFPHAAVCLDFWVFYKTATIEGTIQKVIETTEIVYCLSSHWHSHTACFYGGGTFSLGRWLYPCFALWYLLCLFYWRILLSVIPQKWNPKWIVVISIFISISVGFTNISGILGLHRFFSFMPYFMIGHYYGVNILQYADYKQFTPTHRKILVVSSFFVLMGLASLNPHWLDCIIQPYGSLKVFVIRIAYLCYSLLLCYLLVCIFNFKHDWNENAVSRYGRDTLFFYLLHPYILYPMTILIGGAGKIINIFDSCLITVFTVAILLLMEKIRIIHSFIK